MIEKETYLRLAADFDNYRKNAGQDMKNAIQFGNEKLLLEIADVLDVRERSKGEYDVTALLEQIITKSGATRIETKDKPFDPMRMEAVTMVEGGESQRVKEEVRAGYTMHERVIRPARVIIYQ